MCAYSRDGDRRRAVAPDAEARDGLCGGVERARADVRGEAQDVDRLDDGDGERDEEQQKERGEHEKRGYCG